MPKPILAREQHAAAAKRIRVIEENVSGLLSDLCDHRGINADLIDRILTIKKALSKIKVSLENVGHETLPGFDAIGCYWGRGE